MGLWRRFGRIWGRKASVFFGQRGKILNRKGRKAGAKDAKKIGESIHGISAMVGECLECRVDGRHRSHTGVVCVLGFSAAVVASEAYCEYPAAADDRVARGF
jgi:hypothetical protein